MIEKITPRTKAIVINSPSNPTGVVLSEEILEEIFQLAKAKNLYILSDEIYEKFVYDGSFVSIKKYDTDDRAISVWGLSKSHAMAGWRLGYIIAPQNLVRGIEKIQETLYSCNSYVTMKAAEKAFLAEADIADAMKAEYQWKRDSVIEVLKAYQLYEYTPQGAFYILMNVSKLKALNTAPAEYILEQLNVAVSPGEAFGEETRGYIRISFTADSLSLVEGIKKICEMEKL
jgi:aspartate/methionine/tyrosine aminotransferase